MRVAVILAYGFIILYFIIIFVVFFMVAYSLHTGYHATKLINIYIYNMNIYFKVVEVQIQALEYIYKYIHIFLMSQSLGNTHSQKSILFSPFDRTECHLSFHFTSTLHHTFTCNFPCFRR